VNTLEQAGVKITADADVEDLYCEIDEAIEPNAVREAVRACIEADINRLETEIALIAKGYGLQQLVGITWTSYLTDVNYDELLAELEV
ncbi:MAG: hypothetical protein J6N72_05685, partial [Psychrobacter sp.]|nr:hypothetical protein [Psychrobacter sp.]